jgi:hypothetical protein
MADLEQEQDVVLDRETIIKEFLESKDFIDKINAERGKAVEAFQKEKLPNIIETEFEKRMRLEEEKNKKTPEQIQLDEALKRIEKMEAETAAEKREKLRLENKAHAISELSNKNLRVPEAILDRFISEEPDKTKENIKQFEDFINDYTINLNKEKIKSNNTFVPGGEGGSGNTLQEPGPDASREELMAYEKARRSKIKEK